MPQYFAQMTLGVLLWDYMLTFSDEVEYVWKKEKTWSKSRRISSQNENAIFTVAKPSGFLWWFASIKL